MYEEIKEQVYSAFSELIEQARLKKGNLIVLGCSTSEVTGSKIGTNSRFDCAEAMYSAFMPLLREKGIFLAAQCCEHLGRALVVEREYAERHNLEIVNAVPQPKAGGSSATEAYRTFSDPVLVDSVKADAGNTGTIFECTLDGYGFAIAGGGRYDQMIGKFSGVEVSACGFSIGFERIITILMDHLSGAEDGAGPGSGPSWWKREPAARS